MSGPHWIGVARESLYSPGDFEAADRAILEATADALRAAGARVELVEADVSEPALAAAEGVFAMCQGPAALATLRALAQRGRPLVHVADAIEACHRVRMVPLLQEAGLPRPDARLVESGAPDPAALVFVDAQGDAGVWVKRGDVHATQPEDVQHVRGAEDARRALAAFAGRGVPRAVLEAHAGSRTIKFYAVRGGGFFRAYAGSEALDPAPGWAELADRAARTLGLEIYGGDLVIDDAGQARIVDVNDWPSFSRCRDEAAPAIAARLRALLA